MYTSHRHILTGFPQGMRALLKKIAALAHAHGWSAYIVGGFVRDLLVKRKNYDIDIVVEGDGPALARETARVLQRAVLSTIRNSVPRPYSSTGLATYPIPTITGNYA
jgi:hypothetical protein